MTAKSPTQSRALVAAFAAGLLVSNVAGRFIAGAGAVENTNGMRPAMGFRPVPIQITPTPAPDQLLALQQRMDELESTLFGARAAGDRPRQIQSNVIGDLQNRAEQIGKAEKSERADADDKAAKPERIEVSRVDKVERPERPVRPERPERAGK